MKANEIRERLRVVLRGGGEWGRRELAAQLRDDVSDATLKRVLRGMISDGVAESVGQGRAIRYRSSIAERLLGEIDTDAYFRAEIDERVIREHFNFQLIKEELPQVVDRIFSASELADLQKAENEFRTRYAERSEVERRRELMRLGIDLSRKSSQIEGNTYTLSEAERLLREQEPSEGRTRDEATMLLNHKTALDFLLTQPDYLAVFSVSHAEDIHSILIRELGTERNLRSHRTGIIGTNYRPPDNEPLLPPLLPYRTPPGLQKSYPPLLRTK